MAILAMPLHGQAARGTFLCRPQGRRYVDVPCPFTGRKGGAKEVPEKLVDTVILRSQQATKNLASP